MVALLAVRLGVPLAAAEGRLASALAAGIVMDTATFANPNGLTKDGGSLYSETVNSGAAQIGLAGSGGRGTLSGVPQDGRERHGASQGNAGLPPISLRRCWPGRTASSIHST